MPNGAAKTMKDQNQGTPPSRSAAPDRDGDADTPDRDGALRGRVAALEAESRHAATKADLSEQVSKLREDNSRLCEDNSRLREDTNRQFAELRAEAVKQMAELQNSVEAKFSGILKWVGGFWLSSLALMVLISRT